MANQTQLNVLLCTESRLAYENAKSAWANEEVSIVHYDGSIDLDEEYTNKLIEFQPDIIVGDIKLGNKLLSKKPSNYKIFQLIKKLSSNEFLMNVPVLLFSEFTT